jgi:hypothetical protein
MYRLYDVEIKIRDRICGGIPKHPEIIRSWVEAKTKFDDEQAKKIIRETSVIMATEEIFEDKTLKAWTGFKKDEKGLFIESRQIKAMVKENANILKGVTGAKPIINIRNLQARLAERVFVKPDRIYLGVKEPSGFMEIAIHVFTPKGPRDSLKRVDYVEGPTLKFQLEVLDDGLIGKKELELIVEHAQRLGLGANRSQGYGQFEVLELKDAG